MYLDYNERLEIFQEDWLNILVTGGAGFIGSHLCEELLKNNSNNIYVIDNLSTGTLDNIAHLKENERFHLVIDTIKNEAIMSELIYKCDAVFHLAAAVGVKLIMEQPVETIETNILGTEIVLRYCNKFKKKVLITSTSEVYGKHEEHTLSETDNRVMGPTQLHRWAYAGSKALDEFLAFAYYKEKKLPVVITRLFNTVGPRQTGQYGMVIPRFVQSALLGKPIAVYGDGKQSRSFLYVMDAVKALVKLMDTESAIGNLFNVGHGDDISISDLAHLVKKLTNSSSEIQYIPYDDVYGSGFEDMRRRTPDISKLNKLIDFAPTKNIEGILKKVIEYFKQ